MTRGELSPCPFCEGPPVEVVMRLLPETIAMSESELPDPDGVWSEAYVFCHECGAQGPQTDGDHLYDEEGYCAMQQEAMRLWQQRNGRHRRLYDASRGSIEARESAEQ